MATKKTSETLLEIYQRDPKALDKIPEFKEAAEKIAATFRKQIERFQLEWDENVKPVFEAAAKKSREFEKKVEHFQTKYQHAFIQKYLVNEINPGRFVGSIIELNDEVGKMSIDDFFSMSDPQLLKYLHQYYEHEKSIFDKASLNENEITPPKELTQIKNNFNYQDIKEVYQYFHEHLVKKNYLSNHDLIEYLDNAFDQKKGLRKFHLNENIPGKQKAIRIFYGYYKGVMGKPHGKQLEYASLLGEYFNGYSTQNVLSNFSK